MDDCFCWRMWVLSEELVLLVDGVDFVVFIGFCIYF